MSDYTNEANYKEFVAVYTEQLERVYGDDAGYMAMLARMPEGRNTIEGLAIRMTAGLLSGAANKRRRCDQGNLQAAEDQADVQSDTRVPHRHLRE